MCAGMIRGRKGMFERATKVANWTLSYLFVMPYFVSLNLLWQTIRFKLSEFLYFVFLIGIVLFVWYGLGKFINKKLAKALKKIDQSNATLEQIKKWGWMGLTVMFFAPFLLLTVGIFTINDYKHW